MVPDGRHQNYIPPTLSGDIYQACNELKAHINIERQNNKL